MGKFDLFNKFNSAVIIINENKETVFINNVFKRIFKDYENIKKFSHKLDYEVYPLESNNMSVLSPILQAFKSKEDFSAHVKYLSYDSTGYATYYFDMNSTHKGKYTVVILTDVTAKVKIDTVSQQSQQTVKQINILKDENKSLSKIKNLAESRALKLMLLNKISNIIRSSINTSIILKSALSELSEMFGSFRAYYARYEGSKFKIEESTTKKDINNIISFDKNVTEYIKNGKVSCMTCRKEYNEAEPFKENVQRIIMPIYHLSTLIGVIVLSTKQKIKLDDTLEVLDGVSSQLGNAIIQSELYKKNEQMVVDLTKALKELKETQLQLINSEKMASLGQLVAGVAHEINTPLASIKSNNEIIKKLIKQIENKDLAEILEETNNIDSMAIEKINRLVVSLRKFVRLDEAELQEADINKELDLTLDLIRHETKNGIEIIKNYGNIPPVKCYPNMLNQVFMNILVNATHAIKEKTSKDGQILISTDYKKKNLIVKIKDNGCGIKEPKKIFDVGYTTKSAGIGTGWGLAISQKIIEKHKGKINVKTKINSGSEFSITIPSE